MTDNKRFTIDVETENFENAYFEDDKFLCYEDDYDAILNRLNELAEENIKIKKNCNRTHKENAELIDCASDLGVFKEIIDEEILKLEKENEQLKEENKELKHKLNDFKHEIHRLKHELKQWVMDTDMILNHQLKEENKELKETLALMEQFGFRGNGKANGGDFE